MENKPINTESGIVPVVNIQSMIFTVRGAQVMVDSDLAKVYDVEIRRLNEQVKRNIERFPESFRFQLTEEEFENLKYQPGTSSSTEPLRSQIATLETGRGKHRKYLPYVFTEQGVSMLSAVLRSETAVKVSIQIINAFVEMRRFLQHNANVFNRLDAVERRQISFETETEKNFEKLFQALETGEPPKQGIFFDGQVYDAYRFASDLIRKAKKSLILIDNYVDDSVLTLLCKRKKTSRPRSIPKPFQSSSLWISKSTTSNIRPLR
jgi:phage regulator Rha-like protein